ncbi:hypothetical protein BGX28_007664 [Mortierella sp. GBA30]|nr:hypothetical protein BGX28_007664 [Mortierella sp. GBA30]
MKLEQPESHTSSSGEGSDTEDFYLYDSEELQYPSDTELQAEVSGDNFCMVTKGVDKESGLIDQDSQNSSQNRADPVIDSMMTTVTMGINTISPLEGQDHDAGKKATLEEELPETQSQFPLSNLLPHVELSAFAPEEASGYLTELDFGLLQSLKDTHPSTAANTSRHSDKETDGRNPVRLVEKLQLHKHNIVFAFCASLMLIVLGAVRAHAFVRHVNYAPDDLVGIAQVDIYTTDGEPFRSNRIHPFHIKVLAEDKDWAVHAATAEDILDTTAPVIQDLGNGTYNLHVTKPHRRYQPRHLPASSVRSWLCPKASHYHLHIWFENGTRVPDTPHELEWSLSRRDPRHSIKTKRAYPGSTDQPSTYYTNRTEFDDMDIGAVAFWTEGLLPVLCKVQMASEIVIPYILLASETIFSIFAKWIDGVFGAENVVYRGMRRAKQNSRLLILKVLATGRRTNYCIFKESTSFQESKDRKVSSNQWIKSLTRFSALSGIQLPSAEELLLQADRIMVDIEDRVAQVLASKQFKGMARQLQKYGILEKADQVFGMAECQLQRVLQSEFAQDVHQRAKRKMEEMKATSFGKGSCIGCSV